LRLLLDTCVLIWYFDGSGAISAAMRDELTDPAHELFMSDVSALELVIKCSLGKLKLPAAPSRLLPALARKHLISPLPLTREAIFGLESLPWLHRDPFDRLLVAQALAHHLTLVTPDQQVRQYAVSTQWF
jgi:PIN domain nuclease of toxin-antitoxin system